MDKDNDHNQNNDSPPAPPRLPAAHVSAVFPKRYLIIIAIVVAVAISILFTIRYTTGTFNPFFVVASDSMVPTLQVGDLLIIQHAPAGDSDGATSPTVEGGGHNSFSSSPASYENLKVGDIVLFKNPRVLSRSTGEPVPIVHRVAEINVTTSADSDGTDTSSSQRVLRTKGDHNPASIPILDYPLYKSYYIGKVIYVIPKVGLPFLPAYNLIRIAAVTITIAAVVVGSLLRRRYHFLGRRRKGEKSSNKST